MSCETYNIKSSMSDRFVWKSFHGNSISCLKFLTEICWEEVAEEIFYHIFFSWICLTWGLNPGLMSNKPRQLLLLPLYILIIGTIGCPRSDIKMKMWINIYSRTSSQQISGKTPEREINLRWKVCRLKLTLNYGHIVQIESHKKIYGQYYRTKFSKITPNISM